MMAPHRRTAASTFNRVALDLSHEPFTEQAAALRNRIERVLKQWRQLALKAMPHLDALTLEDFENTISGILAATADALESAEPGRLRGVIDEAPMHGVARFAQKQSLLDFFEEERILRGIIISQLADEMDRPLEVAEAASFHAIFDLIVQQGVMSLVNNEGDRLRQHHGTAVDMNARLLETAVRHEELLEQARRAEEALRCSEERLAAELAAMRRLHEVSSQMIQEGNPDILYEQILHAVRDLMHADFASMQKLYPERGTGGELGLLASQGRAPEAAKLLNSARPDSACACGTALRTGRRCVVPDVSQCEFMADSEHQAASLSEGIRALQCTPLISRSGKLLGMISTYWRQPYNPSPGELRLMDMLARQAADFMERNQAEQSLIQSERQFRRAIEMAPVPVIVHAEDGEVLQISRSWTELTGYTLEDRAVIRNWLLQAYGLDGEAVHGAIQESFLPSQAEEKAPEPVILDIITREGEPRIWSFSASCAGLLPDQRKFVVGMAEDITARQRAEEHQRFLLSELNHRVKNTLTTVQAIAAETRSTANSLAEFHEAFEGRLHALSNAHSLLVKGSWKPASLHALSLELLRTLMRDSRRYELRGQDLALSPAHALTVSMMLYELMTNAIKYGAWSNQEGRVLMETSLLENPDRKLRIQWVERDGPPVKAPAQRGYGTHMLEGFASYELDGKTQIEFHPAGLRCTVEFPAQAEPSSVRTA